MRDGGNVVAAPGTYPAERCREIQTEGVVQAVQYQGAATRVELKLANGEKLLVSQANSDGHAALNAPPVGQTVLASWSRAAMVPLESGG